MINYWIEGAIEGVAVVECANNAVTGGALVPTLALGVPGDVVTAVMLGAMILIGVRPGPLLFQATPLILGVILGPMAEQNLNRALILSGNDYTVMFKSPISLTLLVLAILSIVLGVISGRRESK
ncbi:tripartite tricarboxylate transporter permease [Dictyoglomus sp.]|jgi:TctA family transporter|uniref:tripartite tricarboxylate transporter permease n=1 Tax=Dictyoglomus sp. TaxID=28205 RepID=UPI003CAD737D